MFLSTSELPAVKQPNWEKIMKKQIILAAVAFVTSGVTVAHADSAFEPRSVIVRFADIDTSSPQGAAALYRRLKSAAASVCRDLEPAKELAEVRLYANCLQTALSTAIVKVDRPALTAYAAAHGMPAVDSAIRIATNK
jgi:UrcA family protein